MFNAYPTCLQKCTDIGSYMEAQRDFASADELPEAFSFMTAVHGKNTARALPPAFCQDTTLTNTTTCEGSMLLGGRYDTSVIGPRSFIASGADISASVVYGLKALQDRSSYAREYSTCGHARGIGRNCTLKNVVVCQDVSIGDDVSITNEAGVRCLDRSEDGFVINDGVVVLLRGAVIPDGFTL